MTLANLPELITIYELGIGTSLKTSNLLTDNYLGQNLI